jgi:hypothetical protein
VRTLIQKFIDDHRTAILAIATATLYTVIDGIQKGHLDWKAVGFSALTAIAGIAKSALGGSTSDQTELGEPSAADSGDPKPPLGIAP